MNAFRLALISALLLLIPATQAFAVGERITSFKSDITIRPDSVAEVTETITVTATGEQIKHGIYRDFPTTYRGKLGNNVKVSFRLKNVLRDNQHIPYKIAPLSNGKRIYLGDPDVLIAPGTHSFVLSYEAGRELGYFKDYDEFYWNVTGNGWVFPIDRAEATIGIPPNARILQQSGYTGYSGSTARDYAVTENSGNKITFATTRGLNAREGLTVAVAWPKGFVKEPSALNKIIFYIKDDDTGRISGVIALLLLSIYYFVAWRMIRADERTGTVIPLFAPPKDVPVAAMDYFACRGISISKKALSATIIDMAVNGYLKITQQEGIGILSGSQFSLEKTGSSAALPAIEQKIGDELFKPGDTLILNRANCTFLQGAQKVMVMELESAFRNDYFCTHFRYIVRGFLFTLLAAAITFIQSNGMGKAGFPFFILMLALNALSLPLLSSYTRKGKDVMKEIEGFRMFLSVTETDRFNQLNPPEVTPELFEKYFPYAVALGVENKWADKFSSQLITKGQDPQNYHPRWYIGPYLGSLNQLSSNLSGGLSSAIASSSPPGSSSGSGGGGSSGRGGGGGGGGGF